MKFVGRLSLVFKWHCFWTYGGFGKKRLNCCSAADSILYFYPFIGSDTMALPIDDDAAVAYHLIADLHHNDQDIII